MRFVELDLCGAWLIEPVPATDERGFFARTFCMREYARYALETCFVQHSRSWSHKKGTLRGMHFQAPPDDETKVVTCVKGAVFDVVVDLRPNSRTYAKWLGFELTAENRRQLYIPRGFAHGFQTMEDESEVHYLISAYYAPLSASGVRFDDPAFKIRWPMPPSIISAKDLSWPDFQPDRGEAEHAG